MFTIITTEEYKDLLLAKEDCNNRLDEAYVLAERLNEVEENLQELLLMLVKGNPTPTWGTKFEWIDIERAENIAEYINKNYLNTGLKFEKEKANEQGI